MNLKGSQTEKNLMAAFSAECQARTRYLHSGEMARDAGMHDVADVFQELAANEGEHARRQFEFLGGLGDVRTSIEKARDGERREHADIYPAFARVAREEGFPEVAEFFEKMTAVEGTHENRFQALLRSLDGVEAFRGKTVLHSATRMAQVMLPDQANPSGHVHGGELLKLADNAAGVTAARHCRKDIVLARIADVTFHNPVYLGDLVLVDARITFASRSSVEVRVELEAETLVTGEKRRAITAYMIMVALGEDGKPTEVPPLLTSTEEQERLLQQGRARYEAHKQKSRGAAEAA